MNKPPYIEHGDVYAGATPNNELQSGTPRTMRPVDFLAAKLASVGSAERGRLLEETKAEFAVSSGVRWLVMPDGSRALYPHA